jgi:hypothetical protein
MSDGNNNSFTNLLGGGWNHPYAGSSSNPKDGPAPPMWGNPQDSQYWTESQQSDLNYNFQNLQFSQNSQHSQTEHMKFQKHQPLLKNQKAVENVRQKKSKDPVEDEDAGAGKKGVERWTPNEEKLLAECWVACSEDSLLGISQTKEMLWQRIRGEFNRLSPKERNKHMLQSKWKTLNRDCTKFNAFYKKAQREIKSGENEVDVITRAHQLYR